MIFVSFPELLNGEMQFGISYFQLMSDASSPARASPITFPDLGLASKFQQPANANQWQRIANQWQLIANQWQLIANQRQLIANQWQPMATNCQPMATNLN